MARAAKPKPKIIVETDGRKVLECNKCPKLVASRAGICNGFGPKRSRLAVVAEGPGELEDLKLRPLIGPAGQVLRRWLQRCHVDPDRDVFYDNAIKCWPPGNRKPTDTEIKNCSQFLYAGLEEIQPSLVIAAGNGGIRALLGDIADQGITKLRGHVFWSERLGCKIVPMFHPSAVLHDFSYEPFCLFDLRKAVDEARRPTEMPAGLGDYSVCLTVKEVEELCDSLIQSDYVCFDLETDGLNWQKDKILCVGLTDEVERAWVVPLVGKLYRELWTAEEYERVVAALKRLFESDVSKIAQNGKFDMHFLDSRLGIKVQNFDFDTMLAYHLIHESASHALEPMRSLFTTMPYYDGAILAQTENKTHMEWAEEEDIWRYVGADVDCELRVAKVLNGMLDEEGPGIRWVFENVSMPLQRALYHVEQRGVLIDPVLVDKVVEETDELIITAEQEFFSQVPPGWENINYGSPEQVQKLLYVDLKLPLPSVLTKTGGGGCKQCRSKEGKQHWEHTSTNKDALLELEGAHAIIEPLRSLRSLTTLKSSFLLGEKGGDKGLLQNISEDGRIHTDYRIDGTETGRPSSSPNLQNIPKYQSGRPSVYEHVRHLFCAPEGYAWMEVDYSQVELRILAYEADDESLIALLEGGADIHLYIARKALYRDIDPDMSDKEWRAAHGDLRDKAKIFNFGLGYGMTEWGVARRFGQSVEWAREAISYFLALFPKFGSYMRKIRRQIIRDEVVPNCFGRLRHFFGVKTMRRTRSYKPQMGHIIRSGYNYPIQSGATDVHSLSTAALDQDEWLAERDVHIVLTVHDSLSFEVPLALTEEVARHIKQVMEEIPANLLKWKLPVEVNWGPRWGTWTHKMDADGVVEEMKEAA